MSHVICPRCKSNDHSSVYGCSGPVYGLTTWCNGCDLILECKPDMEGLGEFPDLQVECFLMEAVATLVLVKRDAFGPTIYTDEGESGASGAAAFDAEVLGGAK